MGVAVSTSMKGASGKKFKDCSLELALFYVPAVSIAFESLAPLNPVSDTIGRVSDSYYSRLNALVIQIVGTEIVLRETMADESLECPILLIEIGLTIVGNVRLSNYCRQQFRDELEFVFALGMGDDTGRHPTVEAMDR